MKVRWLTRDYLVLNIAMAVTIALFAWFMSGAAFGWWLVGVAAVALVPVRLGLERWDRQFTARIDAQKPAVFKVWVGGQEVGELRDSEYATYQQAVFRDNQNATAQLMNIGRIFLVVFNQWLVAVPIVCFWLVALFAYLDPNSYITIASAFKEVNWADPAAVRKVCSAIGAAAAVTIVMYGGALMFLGHKFGFRDCYEIDLDRHLRARFHLPMSGDFTDVRVGSAVGGPVGGVGRNVP